MAVFGEARREVSRLQEHHGKPIQIFALDEGMMTLIGMTGASDHFSVPPEVGAHILPNWSAHWWLLYGHLDDDLCRAAVSPR